MIKLEYTYKNKHEVLPSTPHSTLIIYSIIIKMANAVSLTAIVHYPLSIVNYQAAKPLDSK